MKNANFPMDAEGHTYHVGLKRGEVCNRILTVGDPERAKRLAELLDEGAPRFVRETNRGFLTITGRYHGVPVSIIAIGMGMAMMDFMLREVRAVVDGPMCVVRIGTCGSIADAEVGDIIVPEASAAVVRNFDAFADLSHAGSTAAVPSDEDCYTLSSLFEGDAEVTAALRKSLGSRVGAEHVVSGVNVTADTFYAAQGRVDPCFVDRNTGHIERIQQRYPNAVSLEMENFALFHLARCAAPLPTGQSSIRAGAAMIAVFQRKKNESLSKADLAVLETKAGSAVLDVLASSLTDEEALLHDASTSVWA
ncbi:nucleoside phosphorylase domain-containing protein [Thamnocephalis sphaerospora]|uniref:Nucleoside phosphorylase domain-containing protein n=1 Tax=Thamnocephalis sphaerospora TaxID=78915 RepID=A0A4P9XKT5_9FUNG|nr:nucleoside phosphorylase domain-containing protein [Thamnocephalis sphaerospora]|eukprot:RKP06433.1 nucleoside phosphorylase domain-containing protein [Thamnocephalis sphaerospora]